MTFKVSWGINFTSKQSFWFWGEFPLKTSWWNKYWPSMRPNTEQWTKQRPMEPAMTSWRVVFLQRRKQKKHQEPDQLLWKPSGAQWASSLSALSCVYSCSRHALYYVPAALCVCLVESRPSVSFIQLNKSPSLSTDFQRLSVILNLTVWLLTPLATTTTAARGLL